ncbi:MAG TPA: BatA domain-containing protein, partial [Thermoguttaceae bacterium]|nr:BatA domain-containing protein [Thermoguttaceae bacterium]
MSFLSGAFLFGLLGAVGPLVIHLLNRRRQVTIDWAAMDLLLQAVRQQRRRIQIRDLLLLLLRTAAIVFFILAMSRPIWDSHRNILGGGQPVHAVIVVDNSLSMDYTPFDRSLLDLARAKVEHFIRELPSGSDVTLIPTCPQPDTRFADVYDSKEDSLEAVARIRVVDRMARLDKLPEAIRGATDQQGTVPMKRILIVSDMQRQTWSDASALKQIADLGDVQLVEIAPGDDHPRWNSWIESVAVRGGYAESGVPCIFDASIRHQSDEAVRRVRVSLSVAGKVVQERYVDLIADQRNVVSFEYVFDKPGGQFNPAYLPVRVEMEHDRLTRDDYWAFITPVFQQAPILFVDQYGSLEQPESYRYGESLPLRQLIHARTAGSPAVGSARPPHMTIDEITTAALATARLVVVAGVAEPTPQMVQLLREYVTRGGQL